MKMPTLQDGARRRQYPHRQTHRRNRELGEPLFGRSELYELDEVTCQPPHQEEVENKDNNVEQQATIVFGEDI